MPAMRTLLRVCLLILSFAASASAQQGSYLYRAQFVQAAPGKLLALIDACKPSAAPASASADEPPLWMRHSQGDKWDLLLLFPMGNYSDYYRPERVSARDAAARTSGCHAAMRNGAVAWQEDVFVYGPPLKDLRAAFAANAFFHVEIFQALPGKRGELIREREMENAYQKQLGRPLNFIFVRDSGAAWDSFTIGAYRDLKHYAESADIPEEKAEAAARAAGFESAKMIGPYLRTLIREHHDSLCVAIK